MAGPSLYDELLPFDLDLEFAAAAADEEVLRRSVIRSGTVRFRRGGMEVGRGTVEGTPGSVRYRKYARLAVVTPDRRVVQPGEFYSKRGYEEFRRGEVEDEVVRGLKRLGLAARG